MTNTMLAIFIGVVVCIMGIILFYFPPKETNKLDGYQSSTLSANPQIWKDIQKYYASNIIYFGIFFTIFGSLASYFISNFPFLSFCIISFVLLTFIQIFLVERKIKKLL